MTLRFDLGPFEELHIGKCVIKNSHQRALFVVEGESPILKGKDVIPEASLGCALEKLYHCVQKMYLEDAFEKYQGSYFKLAAQSMKDNPLVSSQLLTAEQLINDRDFYKALKGLKKLVRADAFGASKSASENYVQRDNGRKAAR